jgi:hypothetical protein
MEDTQSTEDHPGGGPRPLSDILEDLKKPIPERLLELKRLSGNEITYVPWHRAQKILGHYTRGFWEYQVIEKRQIGNDFCMTVEISVHCAEGTFTRQGTGREEMSVDSFGDPQSNAESMAFRRAAAKWGLGLDLYER